MNELSPRLSLLSPNQFPKKQEPINENDRSPVRATSIRNLETNMQDSPEENRNQRREPLILVRSSSLTGKNLMVLHKYKK